MQPVAFADIQDKMLTLDTARERMAATEPLDEHIFPTGSQVSFEIGEDWAQVKDDEPTSAYMTLGGGARYQLTKQAVLEAGAYGHMPRKYQQEIPSGLWVAQANWWYQTGLGDREFKVLSQPQEDGNGSYKEPLAMAMCRGTIQPFSNIAMLEAMLAGLEKKYGTSEIFVDFKFHHSLERTNLRLIVPGASRVITGTRVADDTWCMGLSLANSLIGVSHPGTRLDGYLFRYWCTNGETDTLASAGKLARRTVSTPADAYAWAQTSVDEILGGLEGSLDAIQSLTEIQVTGDVNLVLQDLFSQFNVPVRERGRIIAAMAELDGDLSLYDVMQAITFAANSDDLSARTVDRLLELGGHVPHAAHDRCGSCRRLLPEGWNVPHEHAHAPENPEDAALN